MAPWALHMAIVPKFSPHQSHHCGDHALSLWAPGRHPHYGGDSDRGLRIAVPSPGEFTRDWTISSWYFRASLNSTGHRWQGKTDATDLGFELCQHSCSFLERLKRNTSSNPALWILTEVLHNLVENHGSCLTHGYFVCVCSFLNRHSLSLKEFSV